MTGNKFAKSFIETISAVLVFLFLYTGLSKYLSFHTFEFTISKSVIINKHAYIVALFLPGIEIITTILLTVPRTRLLGLYASIGLLFSFTSYLIYMVNYAPQLPCSCGGIIQQLSWTQHIILNITLLVATTIAISLYRRKNIKFFKNQGSIV